MRKATIKDVALAANVSLMTVSRVVNGSGKVHADTLVRVEREIARLRYQPDHSARSLRGGHAFSIGLIYDDNPNANYVLSLQNGVLGACRERRYELFIHPCDAFDDRLIDELCLLASQAKLAGLVLTPPMSEDTQLTARLRRNKIRFVRILAAREDPCDGHACVYVDDYSGARAVTTYLIGLGHRSIGFFWGDRQYRSSSERHRGYVDAMASQGLPVIKPFVRPGSYSFDSGFRRARKLLGGDQRPTAIFASNDEIAAGVLAAARCHGLEVPRDLSIAGFEDNPFSRQAWPAITTSRQSTSELGRSAALRLIDGLESRADEKNPGFVPKLVVRDSTAAPPEKPSR